MNDALLADCRSMLATVAPELERYYLLTHPATLPLADKQTLGYASQTVAPQLEEHLAAAGQWQGQAPCIVLLPDAIAACADGELCSFDRLIRRTCLHEAGHILPFQPSPTVDDFIRDEQREVFAYWLDLPGDLPSAEPWRHHGAEFTRIVLHLLARAWDHGFSVLGAEIAAGKAYGMSHPRWYWDALGAEPQRMAGLSFADILATEPPREFSDLFAADVAAWHNTLKTQSAA